ncbi:DUF808 domain-containing protein [Actinobacillus equuli subsp. equuli]|uniref:Inner membrane protein n=1 Tax=Actinobacillus equuli TaxID=718 RepID=A0AAX3FLI8_ACTEU|nr:DUF808 domain-containing protein [Actinobacillus equuli]AIZ78475.1 membrane protein [Actinobacillus equuli subsp. equuli]MDG4951893.1 DUF808 domain-containing protein [Actinobacillus equuli subsp. equuli]WGE42549.1 DUF808 domain-containing protein [Actinobacillus equuli subsp. haemolyticus]WGE44742.1 DUF808 domain-containing protein [Actinobacillus equuli subsp. equuli]WGE46894.1 DUF808 domain-containing protein [Actinobacillus equuli subsp. haemolyticus]
MAFSSLFTLLDDIAAVLDDVSVMTKVAAKKTAGVIGDDLALNANQVSGKNISPDRELPIVWSVAKGSLINKVILIPLALLLSIYLPQAILPLLMIGGAYLCFEGVEKLLHKFLHKKDEHHSTEEEQISEKDKIKGAVRTDFILSAEIIIIALGVLQESSTMIKILSLSSIGIGITVFVYGLVGLIVKLDDIGLWLMQKKSGLSQSIGKALLVIMPWFMKSLSVIGTIAMFLVGGGIFSHNIAEIHHFVEHLGIPAQFSSLVDFVVGIIIGSICCLIILPLMKLFSKKH